MFRRAYLLCITSIVTYSSAALGQNSVWNSSGNAKKSVTSGAEKTKHRLKDYKEHLQTWGQDTSYAHAFLIGGKLNSDGWSGCVNFIKKKSYNTSRFWQVNFSEIKHEKQTKQKNTASYPQFGNALPYVYGKINNLYILQVGLGAEKLLLPAVVDGNLSVSLRYSAGFSLAMLKPYYLKLLYSNTSGSADTVHIEQHKYSAADSAQFLNTNRIFGAASWTKGLNEIDYVPGAYFEAAVAIVPGKSKYFVQMVTLGVNASVYAKSLQIMADQQVYNWNASVFASLVVGKRWK